jgi:two-component system CheB/CheR fusion protein
LDTAPATSELSPRPPAAPAISSEELATIHGILRQATSADLSYYLPELVRRQILCRMALRHIETAVEYTGHLRNDEQEANELFRDVLTRPSGFFEEAGTLNALANPMLGTLWKGRKPDDVFRAWVPGCCSGEEVYSVAIAVVEMIEQFGAPGGVQIFGTDLNERALERARAGSYPGSELSAVDAERVSRFFSSEGNRWRVRRQLREVCLFARQHIASDPPLSKMNLVVFRNQLASVSSTMQAHILGVLHYSLKPGGILVLGQSERVDAAPDLFTALPDRPGIFVRKDNGSRSQFGRSTRGTHSVSEARDGGAPVMNTARRLAAAGPPPLDSSEGRTARAQQHIQALLEEQTHTIEALKVANEEITASNEELMVTNEELTATQEELQAANQELVTVNQEMDARNLALGRTTAELSGLWRNIHVAIVRVDSNLRIRRFTPHAERLFSVAARDVGRPITDLKPKLEIPELERLLKETVADLTLHDSEVRGAEGILYRLSIRPYRCEDDRIDGAMMSVWPVSTAH